MEKKGVAEAVTRKSDIVIAGHGIGRRPEFRERGEILRDILRVWMIGEVAGEEDRLRAYGVDALHGSADRQGIAEYADMGICKARSRDGRGCLARPGQDCRCAADLETARLNEARLGRHAAQRQRKACEGPDGGICAQDRPHAQHGQREVRPAAPIDRKLYHGHYLQTDGRKQKAGIRRCRPD